jgi:hypothetical protein
MTESDYNCGTCETSTCDFNPANPEAYYTDRADGQVKLYEGIECIHEFTLLKGCAVHSAFMAPLYVLEEEINGGVEKYKEMVETAENGVVYILAAKALNVCLQRINILKEKRGGMG